MGLMHNRQRLPRRCDFVFTNIYFVSWKMLDSWGWKKKVKGFKKGELASYKNSHKDVKYSIL